MPKTKISEFSATPGNNTDIDGINIAEGCAPSGINDAIRELMAQLKDFQAGTAGDSFNGPIGTTTPAAGVFTNLSASGTFALTGDQVQISEGGTGQTTANAAFNALAPSQSTHAGKYLKTDGTNTSWDAIEINTADITGTLPVANGGTGVTSSTGTGSVVLSASPTFTGTVNGAALTLSSSLTLSGGTANGVAYLNGSKVLTTGSALSFDGNFLAAAGASARMQVAPSTTTNLALFQSTNTGGSAYFGLDSSTGGLSGTAYALNIYHNSNYPIIFSLNSAEQMRLTSTGLGIGTSSPAAKLTIAQSSNVITQGLLLVNAAGTQNGGWYHGGSALIGRENGVDTIALASGNVGIGTSSPARKLNVVSGSPQIRLSDGTAGSYWDLQSVFANTNQDLLFTNQNGTALTINSSGNLGLGVTPSAWWSSTKALQIGQGGAFESRTGSNLIQMMANTFINTSGSYTYITTDAASRYSQTSGQHQWHTAASGTAGNTISFTQAMTLDASGNLILNGTTVLQSAKLSVHSGSIAAENGGVDGSFENAFVGVYSGNNNEHNAIQTAVSSAGTGSGFRFKASDGGGSSATTTVLDLTRTQTIFYTGGTERARITSGGYFKASNAGTYLSSTGDYHELRSSNDNYLLYAVNTRNSGNGPFGISVEYSAQDSNGTGNKFLQCVGIATIRAEIRSNGGLANYSANDVNLSDRREKTNFAPAKSYLDTICAIPVQTFNYIDQSEDDPGLTLGVVAQDVQAVAPELVMESNWGTAEDPKMRLSIYQTDLQYALMKCIQELKAQNDDLRARVAQLEAK